MRWLEEVALRCAPIRKQAVGRLALAALAALAVALAGPLAGPDVGFDFLCLWPIGFVTWGAGMAAGFALALACAAASFAAGFLAHGGGPNLSSRVALHLWNFVVQFGVFGSQILLLTALRAQMRRDRRLALTDEVTGIPNRRAFDDAADRELERARRQGRPVTLVYLDVDDFKQLNDRFGHASGDEVLRIVGVTLRDSTRRLDTPARIGGDEFALLLPDTSPQAAAVLVGRLRGRLGAALAARGWAASLSVGAVTFERAPPSRSEMLSLADGAMYRAKRAGKGTIYLEVAGQALRPDPLQAPMPA
jgi:diguanylate cyclase (GGDEF)-like protein